LLASCGASHYVTGTLEGKGISIPLSEFSSTEKGKQITRQYIVVHQDQLEFPIYLYRISENEFTALLMKCAHQGSELNAAGDHLYCSSHGSEYDSRGNVTHGPAQKNLRSFPVSVQTNKLIIELTKE
jgi:Rieske Fe-S protein